jgi:hypothetical protein
MKTSQIRIYQVAFAGFLAAGTAYADCSSVSSVNGTFRCGPGVQERVVQQEPVVQVQVREPVQVQQNDCVRAGMPNCEDPRDARRLQKHSAELNKKLGDITEDLQRDLAKIDKDQAEFGADFAKDKENFYKKYQKKGLKLHEKNLDLEADMKWAMTSCAKKDDLCKAMKDQQKNNRRIRKHNENYNDDFDKLEARYNNKMAEFEAKREAKIADAREKQERAYRNVGRPGLFRRMIGGLGRGVKAVAWDAPKWTIKKIGGVFVRCSCPEGKKTETCSPIAAEDIAGLEIEGISGGSIETQNTGEVNVVSCKEFGTEQIKASCGGSSEISRQISGVHDQHMGSQIKAEAAQQSYTPGKVYQGLFAVPSVSAQGK